MPRQVVIIHNILHFDPRKLQPCDSLWALADRMAQDVVLRMDQLLGHYTRAFLHTCFRNKPLFITVWRTRKIDVWLHILSSVCLQNWLVILVANNDHWHLPLTLQAHFITCPDWLSRNRSKICTTLLFLPWDHRFSAVNDRQFELVPLIHANTCSSHLVFEIELIVFIPSDWNLNGRFFGFFLFFLFFFFCLFFFFGGGGWSIVLFILR